MELRNNTLCEYEGIFCIDFLYFDFLILDFLGIWNRNVHLKVQRIYCTSTEFSFLGLTEMSVNLAEKVKDTGHFLPGYISFFLEVKISL